ncbi:HAD family hydrolase [Roseimarinus sediminis]|uniref:HAD family hydrolase n=1 Tax=Roseimarinus sediminis TaxID=1610899 RepID=UPI003D1D4124
MPKITTIIWDWNGTLLNDTDVSLSVINRLLDQRKLPLLSRETYLDVFGFPVKDYYQRIGFDFAREPFEIPARQYIDLYYSKVSEAGLHKGVHDTLKAFAQRGYKQLILSAAEQIKLLEFLINFELDDYFEQVSGLNNHYASSKTELGIKLLKETGIDPETAVLIGDTTHDYDVAKAMGCQCILLANGHQSAQKLRNTGAIVLENISQLPQVL